MKNKNYLKKLKVAIKVWIITNKRQFRDWYLFRKNVFHLWKERAPKEQILLTKGAYYLRKGAIFQVGQPIVTQDLKSTKKSTKYIKNLYFNFAQNKITASYSQKPIKGISEHFTNAKS